MKTVYANGQIECEDRSFHPLSGQLRAVLQASAGSMTSLARALTVTIESLLLETEAAVPKLTSEETEWLRALRQYVRNSKPPGHMRDRVMGLLGLLKRRDWSNALRHLVEVHVITQEQARVTKELRNRVAHGDTLSHDDPQSLTTKCSTLLVVLYRLIFHRIGYQGVHTDYSTLGWPEAEFPYPSNDALWLEH